MAFRLLSHTAKQTVPKSLVARAGHSSAVLPTSEQQIWAPQIGTREIVGHGWSGLPVYHDRVDFPFPAIRYRENTPELLALREKEKGDWKKLSVHEKKTLYRASFCQTFEEFKAPTGEWKLYITGIFLTVTAALWFAVWMRKFVLDPLPESFSLESRKAQLERMLIFEVNPVDGLSSKWDYENKRWK